MVFDNQYREHKSFFSESGSPTRVIYEPYYDENGNIDLKETGKFDQYMDIQSHADSVDINVIMARYLNGDADALNRVQGFYADVSKAPKSYADMLNISIKAQNEFDQLPVDVKEKFGNNFAQFLAIMGSPEWFEKLGVKPADNIKDEVKTEEVKFDES